MVGVVVVCGVGVVAALNACVAVAVGMIDVTGHNCCLDCCCCCYCCLCGVCRCCCYVIQCC